MSKLMPNEVVVGIAKACKPRVYVELGVRQCTTINAVLPYVGHAIAVDKRDFSRSTRAEFFKCSTCEFFKRWHGTADMFYIDADHHAEQVRTDFDAAAERLNPHGIIALHDTNPINEAHFAGCFDAYKVVEYIRDAGFGIVNLPTGIAGTAIVMRGKELRWSS